LDFDDVKQAKLGSIVVPGGPQYISIPPGETVYATTRMGGVIALDLNGQRIVPLVTGGPFGAMDYDASTGEVYVPDTAKNQLIVLKPVNQGSPLLHQPGHVVDLKGAQPASIAITSDGQLGFAALTNGTVAMIDIPGPRYDAGAGINFYHFAQHRCLRACHRDIRSSDCVI